VKNRTPAAKAVPAQYIYGTAEAVPFVQSIFPQPVQRLQATPEERYFTTRLVPGAGLIVKISLAMGWL
jgi:hypothetical protein